MKELCWSRLAKHSIFFKSSSPHGSLILHYLRGVQGRRPSIYCAYNEAITLSESSSRLVSLAGLFSQMECQSQRPSRPRPTELTPTSP